MQNMSVTSFVKNQPVYVIGEGSFGKVLSIVNPNNGEKVAVKTIARAFESTQTAITVMRELKMLFFFNHENILSAIQVLHPLPNWKLFKEVSVMTELLYGNLNGLLNSGITLTNNEVRVIFYQLMRGLKHIHSAGIIHRDIKPHNVVLNQDFRLKICDFGIAIAEIPEDSKEKLSVNCGTFGYQSPEMVLGAEHYTSKVDIWSAACVFVEVLGLQLPFEADSRRSNTREIINLVGSPELCDVSYAHQTMCNFLESVAWKPSMLADFCKWSPHCTDYAVDLLERMFQYNPDKRMSAVEVLTHPYLDIGREIYHTHLCKCCTIKGDKSVFATNFEPSAPETYNSEWESQITTVREGKDQMFMYISKCHAHEEHMSLVDETLIKTFNPEK